MIYKFLTLFCLSIALYNPLQTMDFDANWDASYTSLFTSDDSNSLFESFSIEDVTKELNNDIRINNTIDISKKILQKPSNFSNSNDSKSLFGSFSINDLTKESNNNIIDNAIKKVVIIDNVKKNIKKTSNLKNSNAIIKPFVYVRTKLKTSKYGKNPTKFCQYCNKGLSNDGSLYNHEKFYCKVALEKGIIKKLFTCASSNCTSAFALQAHLESHKKRCKYRNKKIVTIIIEDDNE